MPYVSAWLPPERRGLAIGVFGAGAGGTAISALTTAKLVDAYRTANPFLITSAVLALYAVVAWWLLRDAPGRTVPAEPPARRLGAAFRLGVTRQASALYAVALGGYVAFSVYLPAYLKTGYGLAQATRPTGWRGSCCRPWRCGRSAAGCRTASARYGLLSGSLAAAAALAFTPGGGRDGGAGRPGPARAAGRPRRPP